MKLREGSEWLFDGLVMHEIKLIKNDGLTVMDKESLDKEYIVNICVGYRFCVYLPHTELISPIFDRQYLRT